jgi:hypothetical protein
MKVSQKGKKKQKKLKEIKITHSEAKSAKKDIFQEWGKEKEKTRRRKLTPSRSGW